MATLESTPKGGKFSASDSITVRNDALACNNPCAPGGDYSTAIGIILGTMHIHLTHLAGVRGWAKSQVLWCNAHNVWVGVQMAELATL
jgi:hypothetical protein